MARITASDILQYSVGELPEKSCRRPPCRPGRRSFNVPIPMANRSTPFPKPSRTSPHRVKRHVHQLNRLNSSVCREAPREAKSH